jgi:MFS family permease
MTEPGTAATRRWWVLAVVSAAQFLTILDLWVVNIALPALQHDFTSATLADVSWIVDIYAIVLAALLLPAGRAADSIGRRRCFLAGLVVFGGASLGCTLAPALPVLIAWRGVQAAGAAMLMPTSLGLALSVFPLHQRRTAVGVWAAVGGVAGGCGPILGGLLTAWSWRLIFAINLPLAGFALLAGAALLPRDARPEGPRSADLGGTLLALAAIGLTCLALTEAPAWPPARAWTVLAAGLGLAIAFVAHIRRHPDPVLSPHLFAAPGFAAAAAGLVAYYVGFAAMLLGTTLFLTQVFGFSTLQAAAGIAPGPLTAAIGAPFSALVTARLGIRATVLTGAALFTAAGAWPLAMASQLTGYATAVLPSMLLWGLANALIQPPLFAAADTAPRADLASGSAVLSMARQAGSALGVAILVAVLGAHPASAPGRYGHAWVIVLASAVLTGLAGLASAGQRNTTGQSLTRPAATPAGSWKRRAP